jgi:hypothetical protein
MTSTNIVDMKVPASTGKSRVSYGIDICIGSTVFNEWGLSESEAKDVNDLLTLNGEEPLDPTSDGVVYKRRPLSVKKSEFAAMKVALLAKKQAPPAAAQG